MSWPQTDDFHIFEIVFILHAISDKYLLKSWFKLLKLPLKTSYGDSVYMYRTCYFSVYILTYSCKLTLYNQHPRQELKRHQHSGRLPFDPYRYSTQKVNDFSLTL